MGQSSNKPGWINSLVANGLMMVIAVVMAAPLIRDFMAGRGTDADGAAPVVSVMVFALMAPVSMMVTQRLPARLMALGVALVAALVVRASLSLIEGGQVIPGAVVALLGIAAATGGALYQHRRTRRRKAATQALASEVAQTVDRLTRRLRAKYGEAAFRPKSVHAPIHVLALTENLALGVVWQAATVGEPEEFATGLLQGLHDMRNDVFDNKVTDPHGYTAAVIDLYLIETTKLLKARGLPTSYRTAANGPAPSTFKAIRDLSPPIADSKAASGG